MLAMNKQELMHLDINNHVAERLAIWIEDSTDLYKTGGLSWADACEHMVFCLISAALSNLVAGGTTQAETIEYVTALYKIIKADAARLKRQSHG